MTFAKYPVTGGGGGGSGDVVGPASATSDAIVLFDGITGKLIKDSAILSSAIVLTSGNQTIGGTKTFSSEILTPTIALTATSNQMSFGSGANKITVNVPNNPAANLTYSMPNIAAVSLTGTFCLLEATNQTFSGTGTIFSQTVRFDASTPLFLGASPNRVILSPGSQASPRTWLFPDLSTDPTFAALEGTQSFSGNKTFAGTLTVPGSVNYTSAGSITKSGAGALTITNASTAGLTFAGTGTVSAPTGTYTLAGLSLGNVFTVAQTISATTNQIVLGTTNTTTINSAAPAASRTYNIIDAGGAADFVMTAGSQTLTSKTLTAPILSTHADYTNIATPATPGAGVLRVYSKSDSRLYRVDSTGLEVAIGGGLDPVERSTTLNPAVVGTLYVCNTSAGGFTITLPTGSSKASIGFLDARETFATNNLTIAPATGQAIDGQAVNETLVLDVSGSWVILTWSVSDSRWVIQSSAPGSSNQAIVQNGNTLGAAMNIGTNDSQVLNLRTAGTTKVSAGTAGDVTVGPTSGLTTPHIFRNQATTDYVARFDNTGGGAGSTARILLASSGTNAQAKMVFSPTGTGTSNIQFLNSTGWQFENTAGTVIASQTDAGAVTLSQIHNRTDGNINSGRYTPTLTGVTNIVSAGTAASCHYTRVGNIVTVAISISTITTTSAGASTQLDASLPIASNLTGFSDALGGGGVVRLTATISSAPVVVEANATNDRFSFYWVSPVTTAVSLYITAQYEVK